MSSLFCNCVELESLPDISLWDTSKVENINGMFAQCEKLSNIPDISKWDISKVTKISNLFFKCKSLQYLPDISKWNISQLTDLKGIFKDCNSLINYPDISKWKIKFQKYNTNNNDSIYNSILSYLASHQITINSNSIISLNSNNANRNILFSNLDDIFSIENKSLYDYYEAFYNI